jgi:hypothetical protein
MDGDSGFFFLPLNASFAPDKLAQACQDSVVNRNDHATDFSEARFVQSFRIAIKNARLPPDEFVLDRALKDLSQRI